MGRSFLNAAEASAPPAYPSAVRAWTCVILLTLLYATSFVDRYILALLASSVAHELAIDDTMMGLLMGAGFACVYSLAGFPLAALIDRRARCAIVVAGAVLWNVTTALSGFATNVETLALLRAGVAIGEAVLTPAAVSLIADLFPRERRGSAISIYSAVGGAMGFGSLIFGAAAIGLATSLSPAVGMPPWRITFVLLGAIGFVLALLFAMLVREPARSTAATDMARDTQEKLGPALRRDWTLFLPYLFAIAALTTYAMAKYAWLPTFVVRAFHISPAQAGMRIGATGLIAGLVGAFFWPWLVRHLERRGWRHPILLCQVVGTALSLPFIVLSPLASSPMSVIVGLSLTGMFLATTAVLTPLFVQEYGRAHHRARLMAIALMAYNLIGLAIGPVVLPMIAAVWKSSFALGYAMALLGGVLWIVGVGGYGLAYLSARRRRTPRD